MLTPSTAYSYDSQNQNSIFLDDGGGLAPFANIKKMDSKSNVSINVDEQLNVSLRRRNNSTTQTNTANMSDDNENNDNDNNNNNNNNNINHKRVRINDQVIDVNEQSDDDQSVSRSVTQEDIENENDDESEFIPQSKQTLFQDMGLNLQSSANTVASTNDVIRSIDITRVTQPSTSPITHSIASDPDNNELGLFEFIYWS